jgi:esterase/lipase
MSKKIFVISGLGADHEVFHKLDLPGYELIHIKWVETKKNESLAAYATKLLPQITEANPIVMGLSHGGMLALEVSKQIQTEKIISLSSAIGYDEISLVL